MYCPNCGKQASVDQRFCRSCGFSLEKVSELFTSQPSTAQLDEVRLEKQIAKLVFWGLVGSIGGLVVAMLGDKVIGDLSATAGALIEYAGKVMLAGGVGLLIYSGIRSVWFYAYGSMTHRRSSQPTALPHSPVTMRLLPERHAESMPSVTEYTTELLEKSGADTPAQDKARQRE